MSPAVEAQGSNHWMARELVKEKKGGGRCFPGDASGKESTCQRETQEKQVPSLDGGDPLEKEMATRSSILAWEIPWMEEPGRLQSTGPPRVGHD